MTTAYSPATDTSSTGRVTPAGVALVAAVAALTLWAAKAAVIAASGVDHGFAANALFLAGLLACLTAALSLGIAVTRPRPLWVRIAAGVGAMVLGGVAATVVNALIVTVRDPEAGAHWLWGEVNLWIVGATVLALAVALRSRSAQPGDLD